VVAVIVRMAVGHDQRANRLAILEHLHALRERRDVRRGLRRNGRCTEQRGHCDDAQNRRAENSKAHDHPPGCCGRREGAETLAYRRACADPSAVDAPRAALYGGKRSALDAELVQLTGGSARESSNGRRPGPLCWLYRG